MRPLSTKLRESLLEKGACLVGYADVSDLSYQVLEGLKNGEKVISSSYDLFGDNDRIVFK